MTRGRPGDVVFRPGPPVYEYLPYLKELGFDGISLCTWFGHTAYPLSLTERGEQQLRETLESLGLNVYALGSHGGSRHVFSRYGYLTTDQDELAERIAYLKSCLHLAARLGVKVVDDVTGDCPSGVSEDEAFERLAAVYKELCETAGELGVRIGIEPYTGPVGSPEAYWRLKEAVNHPAMGCTLDHSNLMNNGVVTSPSEGVYKLASEIVHVHVKGMGERGMTTPGGPEDRGGAGEVLNALREIGYQGAVSLEEYPDAYRPALDPYDAARAAYASMAKLMSDLGVRPAHN